MSFTQTDYIDELNDLNIQIKLKNPSDVLQFCADYFNQRLKDQREMLWEKKTQIEQVSGVQVFPTFEQSKIHEQRKSIPSFKTPFGDNDPHSATTHHDHESNDDPHAAPAPQARDINAGIFKGGFNVGNAPTSSISKDVDPSDTTTSNVSIAPFEPKTANLPKTFNAHRRISVSAEILNPDSFKEDSWTPPKHDLTSEQLLRLKETVAKNFLFSGLDEESLNTLIHALEEKRVPTDTEIIKQGDEGDFFYVVEQGTVDFYVNGAKVNTSGQGSSFGELALMYNSPRAATAVASTDCILWALDRMTFRRILLEGTAKRRSMYEEFLKEVDVLKPLSSYERNKLADALHTETFEPGTEIVKEGEQGESFYIIESGDAQISKKAGGVIGVLHKGDYFGEVALLNDLPRQATITALTTVKVVTLGKSGFQRLLGPAVEESLKEHDPTQHK